jgi:hypothetical protein
LDAAISPFSIRSSPRTFTPEVAALPALQTRLGELFAQVVDCRPRDARVSHGDLAIVIAISSSVKWMAPASSP